MRVLPIALFAFVWLVVFPSRAAAGQLRLEFRDGTVSISAADVPLKQVLIEWARLGQTRIVNLERLAGAPLTVELANVPEKQALEVILRNVPGYLVAQRAVPSAGGSQFDRIVVMPGTIPPAQPASRAAAPPPMPPPMPPQMPPPVPQGPVPPMTVEDQDQPVEDADSPEQPEAQQPQLLTQPGIQPMPQAPKEEDGEAEQPNGPVTSPGPGVVAPAPGQLPLPQRKPPEQ